MSRLHFDVVHRMHIDKDFKWSGEDPNTLFELTDKLGEGAFGAVYKATMRTTGGIFAVKILPALSNIESLEREIEILKKCQHQNIVGYYGTCKKAGKLWILMDYCELGSIKDLMRTCETTLNEQQIAFVCKNVSLPDECLSGLFQSSIPSQDHFPI